MELLDRYLNFIRFLLPRGKQHDIIDELSEDLRAQIADKEAGLGRPLDSAELEAILKQCGHPLLVAGRYQSQQQLISQPFFPLYLFALKGVAWVIFPLTLLASAVVALFRSDPIPGLLGSFGMAFTSAMYMVGVLTVLFMVLDRLKVKLTFLEDWKPSELPKMPVVPDAIQIPRTASFGGFIGCVAFLLWWTGILHLPATPQVQFLNPLPASFFWPVLAMFGAEMVLHGVNFFMPWWTRRRAALRLGIDLFAVGLAVALLDVFPWFALEVHGAAPLLMSRVELLVNGIIYVSVVVTALSYVFRILQDLRRARGLPPFSNPLLIWFGSKSADNRR